MWVIEPWEDALAFDDATVRMRLVPELCAWPGDLVANRSHPARGPYLQMQRKRLLWRYGLVRIMQRLGWTRPPLALMEPLRGLTALVPLDQDTQAAACRLLQCLNHAPLAALNSSLRQQGCGSGAVLPVIVSCRHRLQQAQQAQKAFSAPAWPGLLRPLIVVGQEKQADWAFRFDRERNVLTIAIDDAYEGLPLKVVTAAAVLALVDTPPQLLKLDDDARPGELQALNAVAERLTTERPMAAGYPIVTPSPLHLDRGWHLGKSRRANDRVFASLGTREWISGGAGYLLNVPAMRLIQSFWLHSWDFVTSMLYEDVCVSMLLQAGDAEVNWLRHPADLGLLTERQVEVDDGHWSIPDGFFESSR